MNVLIKGFAGYRETFNFNTIYNLNKMAEKKQKVFTFHTQISNKKLIIYNDSN